LQKPLPWAAVLEYQYPKLEVREKVILDFGAGGKGYLIDIVGNLLEKDGCTAFTIDAGGDILSRTGGGDPLRVGLEDPQDVSKVIGVVTLGNRSIAGSAGNRRRWKGFHHIINPETLTSPEHILGLWVIADTTLVADLLATALFFVEPEVLSAHFDFEFLLVGTSRRVKKSSGFEAELFS
jgi:thiamine biosynthesis lipoprotein